MQTDPASPPRRRRGGWSVLAIVILLAAGVTTWWSLRRLPAVPTPLPEVHRSTVERANGLLVLKGRHQPFTGRLFENHADGSRKLEIEVRAGRLEGRSRGWFPGGQPENEETFVADFSEGPRTRWFPNGSRKSLASIHHGQLQGLYTEWHENGRKAVVMTMKDGKANGVVEAWHPSGALKSRTTMDHGNLVNREVFADPAEAQALTE